MVDDSNMCFFDMDSSTEGTNSSNKLCLKFVYVCFRLFYVCVETGFVDWLEKRFMYELRVSKCEFAEFLVCLK